MTSPQWLLSTMSDPLPSSVQPGEAAIEPRGGLDFSSAIEKMKELLQAKDDTSRFVGLALLKSILDNGQLAQESENLRLLWEAMSAKFLDRLLRAPQSEKVNKAQSKDMVDLAVAVLHTFTILLPEDSRKEKRLVGRTGPLVKAVVQRYNPEPTPSSNGQLTCLQFSRNHESHFTNSFDYCESARRRHRVAPYPGLLPIDRNSQPVSTCAGDYQLHVAEFVNRPHRDSSCPGKC